jgi:hypothetical protein
VLGVFAASTIGMSTAVLGAAGVAQATTGPVSLTASTPLTVPAGVCTVEWVLNGAAGSGAGSQAGGLGAHMVLHMSVAPGETMTVSPETMAGGAAGTGGGAGGNGIGLVVGGSLKAAVGGGGGAGTWNHGGSAENPGGGYGGTTYTYDGGQPGTGSAVGTGAPVGTDSGGTADPGGVAGADGAAHGGGAGAGAGAGGGGGGYFGGGSGASDGTGGTGGGGGSNLVPDGSGAVLSDATGPAAITYEFQACTAEQMPLAPTDLTAHGSDGTLTVDFTPNWNDAGPDTWEYQLGSGAWTPFTPGNSPDRGSELVLHSLTNGTAYTVHVRGVSSDGVPGPAGSATGTPFKPIGAPTNVAYTVSGNVVTITWDAPATAGTFALAGYQAGLGYNWGESGGLAFMCKTDAAVHICKAPAPPGPNYTFAVNAVDAQGNAGDPSQMLNVSKIAPPASVPASSGALAVPSGPGATGSVVKGQQVSLHGTGYAPNSLISVIIYSTPQVLTTVMTDGSGSFTVSVTVPAGLPDGHHTLVAAGVDPSGQTRYLNLGVTVTAGSAELAYTGASIVGPGIAGLVALTVGTGLLLLSRRRRTS